jgi:hypothetical protein
VDVVVSRGDRLVGQDELDYLFGRGKRPANMPDDNLFRASTVEIPITLHRDGWQFDHAEIQLDDKRVEQKTIRTANWVSDFKLAAKAAGPTVNLQLQVADHEIKSGGTVDAIPAIRETSNWSFTFPERVLDYSFAAVTVGGNTERSVTNKDHWRFRGSNPETSHAGYFYGWHARAIQTYEKDGKQQEAGRYAESSGVRTEDPGSKGNAAEARKDFLKEYGEDAAAWWFEDYRADNSSKTFGPPKGDAPWRELIRGLPPLEERKYVTGEGGTYPLLAYSVPPWRVYAIIGG